MPQRNSKPIQSRNGALLPLIAVCMVILFVSAVLAIDIARIHVTRSELRTATDAAARAAVESLGRTESESEAIQAALRIAKLNPVAGTPLTLDRNDVEFGFCTPNADGSFSFAPRGKDDEIRFPNSVRVLGRRVDGAPDGPVNMMFGGMFGQDYFQPIQSATATRLDRDIALVLDKSGSMGSNGRFPALKNGIKVFVEELKESKPKENVSLIAYSTSPTKLLDLTDKLEEIITKFDSETPDGRTGIGLAMRMGIDSVTNDPKARKIALKSIIVMTDGNQNEGISPLIAAYEAEAANIVVHTITFSDGADQKLMQQVAEITGGIHLHATSDDQLVDAFEMIAKQLQVLLIE